MSLRFLRVKIVQWACTLVARRAAIMSGIAVAGIMIQTGKATLRGKGSGSANKSDREEIIVGVDGRQACMDAFVVVCPLMGDVQLDRALSTL